MNDILKSLGSALTEQIGSEAGPGLCCPGPVRIRNAGWHGSHQRGLEALDGTRSGRFQNL